MNNSIWKRLDRFPPVLCRLLARLPKGRPLTTEEIAHKSVILNEVDVAVISKQTNWFGIPIQMAIAFMKGCDCDVTNPTQYKRMLEFLKYRHKGFRFKYLQGTDDWATTYMPLIFILRRALTEKPKFAGLLSEISAASKRPHHERSQSPEANQG